MTLAQIAQERVLSTGTDVRREQIVDFGKDSPGQDPCSDSFSNVRFNVR